LFLKGDCAQPGRIAGVMKQQPDTVPQLGGVSQFRQQTMGQFAMQLREESGVGQQTGFAVERDLAALSEQRQQGGAQTVMVARNLQQLQHPVPALQSLIAAAATGPYRIKQLHQQRQRIIIGYGQLLQCPADDIGVAKRFKWRLH
jgi:hypothetical protein